MHYRVFIVFPLLSGMAQALVRRYPADSAYSSMASSAASRAMASSAASGAMASSATSRAVTSPTNSGAVPSSAASGAVPSSAVSGAMASSVVSGGMSTYISEATTSSTASGAMVSSAASEVMSTPVVSGAMSTYLSGAMCTCAPVVSGAIPTSDFVYTSMAYTSLPSNTAIPSTADGCAPYASGTGSVKLTCYSTGIPEYTPGVQYQMPLCYSTILGSFNSASLPVAPTVMPCFTMSGNVGPVPSVQTTAWQSSPSLLTSATPTTTP